MIYNIWNKNILGKIFLILLFFLVIELILHTFYYLLKDRFFYTYHLNKNQSFTEYSIHGGLKFKPNVLAHMPGYPDNLFTNKYGFVDNSNFDHDLTDHSKYNIFITGGSTVEGRGASSNKNTISSNLELCLIKEIKNVQVINSGFSGDFSYQEFMRMAGKILPNFKVDMIIHFGGKNDAHNSFAEGKEWKINNQKYFNISDYSINNTKTDCISCAISNKLNKISITFYSLNYFLNKIQRNNLNKSTIVDSNYTIAKENMKKSIKNYLNNLNLMHSYYSSYDIDFYAFLQPYLHINTKIVSNNELLYLEKFENDIGQNYHNYINEYFNSMSFKNHKINFFDISNLFINENKEVYFDSFHYNDLGNKLISNKICEFILN